MTTNTPGEDHTSTAGGTIPAPLPICPTAPPPIIAPLPGSGLARPASQRKPHLGIILIVGLLGGLLIGVPLGVAFVSGTFNVAGSKKSNLDPGLQRALESLRNAAKNRDWESAAPYINFPSVRTSVRVMLKNKMIDDAQKSGDPLDYVLAGLGDQLVGIVLDKYMNEGVFLQILNFGSGQGEEGSQKATAEQGMSLVAYYAGRDMFVYGTESATNADKNCYAIFERKNGADWRWTAMTAKRP